jgi:hypothetical protein
VIIESRWRRNTREYLKRVLSEEDISVLCFVMKCELLGRVHFEKNGNRFNIVVAVVHRRLTSSSCHSLLEQKCDMSIKEGIPTSLLAQTLVTKKIVRA